MSIRLFLILSLTPILCVASRASAANLLVNPGFETGDLTGWTSHGASSGSNSGVNNPDRHSETRR